MARPKAPHVTRRVLPGATRADAADTFLDCILLAPAPEWVAVDVATGALVRGTIAAADLPEELGASPLSSLRIVLAPLSEPWDPSRPEAVAVSDATKNRAPARRAVRRLLGEIARPDGEAALLGGVGPSVAFVDLSGDRPSVALVAPAGGRVRFTGDAELVAHFRLGPNAHSLPVAAGAAGWLRSGQLPTAASNVVGKSRRDRRSAVGGQLGPGIEPTVPVLVTVGFGRPAGGQVRKAVLGVLPAP